MALEPGLNTFYEPPPGTAIVADIVFIHGLGGGCLSTWTEGSVCWPRDLLRDDVPQARILSYGYDSKVVKLAESTSRTSIAGHADSLLNEIGRKRRQVEDFRPIIFVCHSLGGLVAKQALIRSSEYYHNQQAHHAELAAICPLTAGVIFMGTPHRGSGKATLGKIAANAGKILGADDRVLRALEHDSQFLDQQRNSFDSIRRYFLVVCLWEEKPVPVLGMVVPESSACIDGPDVLKEHIPSSDHRSMVKFSSKSQKGYQIALDYINRCIRAGMSHGTHLGSGQESESVVQTIADRCVLELLGFPEMNQRYANIETAHRSAADSRKSTYDWMFSEHSDFAQWLRSSGGLFWLNGKAGSGKSTLMKFIAQDPRLHSLQKMGSSPALFARFFFWAAGTSEQKSQEGLLRTILHNFLDKRRDLIRILFGNQWGLLYELAIQLRQEEKEREKEKLRFSEGRTVINAQIESEIDKRILRRMAARADPSWHRSTLLDLVTQLFEQCGTSKVFILLDGLDEFEGSEDELDELTSLLKLWSRHPNVKICVSTRPWAIFEDSFGDGTVPSIRLQDLTSGDIACFVKDSFNSSSLMRTLQQANPQRIPDFYSTVVAKAEGVFLWVRLVVKSVKDGLRHGDELSVLKKRVEELPADLDKLYRHMIHRIPERYWPASARLFKIIYAADRPPRATLLWYAGERNYDPLEFHLTDDTKIARCHQVNLRLMSQCCGLLELRGESGLEQKESEVDLMRPEDGGSFSSRQHHLRSTVHYLHRTAKDFLEQSDVKELLNGRLEGSSFDGYSWLAIHSLIAVLECHSRMCRAQVRPEETWEMFGFELNAAETRYLYCLERSENAEVVKSLEQFSYPSMITGREARRGLGTSQNDDKRDSSLGDDLESEGEDAVTAGEPGPEYGRLHFKMKVIEGMGFSPEVRMKVEELLNTIDSI